MILITKPILRAANLGLWLALVLPSAVTAQEDEHTPLVSSTGEFALRFSQLSRFEFLDGQYRRANNGSSDQVFVSRTAIEGSYGSEHASVSFELLDARQALADEGTPLTRRSIDAANLQQLYLTWRSSDAIEGTPRLELNLGRQSLNMGSRRLLSRSTSNVPVSYTGLVANLQQTNGQAWKAFLLVPVLSYPTARADILDNRIERDKESRGARLAGIFTSLPETSSGLNREYYLVDFRERDAVGEEVADMKIMSAGTHYFTEPKNGQLDYDLEAIYQAGTSRASSSPTDTQDLKHRAYFYHFALGYLLARPFAPHLQLLYDYASGDKNPNDDEFNRFDTLFGARRSEFGPSSLYGPFGRANLSTLGLRLTLEPRQDLEMTFTLRDFALADKHDAWEKAAWHDSDGESGKSLGRHLETRLRWDAIPGNLAVDTGLVWLHAGNFPRAVSQGTAPTHTRYAYLQTSLSF